MQRPAELICQVLERQRPPIYPECKLCARKRGFQEHLPGAGHFTVFLGEVFEGRAGRGNLTARVVGHVGHSRWLRTAELIYADGAIEMCRGVPPTAASAPSSSTSAPQDAVPGGAAAPVQRPVDVAPQRSFGEVPAGAPRVPEGDGDGDAQGAAEAMCCYLWACLFQGRAYRCQHELQLHGAAAPGKRIACQVCGGDVHMVPEGIAAHLLSPSHVRNLVRRTPNLAGHL